MKKYSGACLALCLVMLLQMLCIPVMATETENTQPTEMTIPAGTTQTLEFGQAPTARGCRTLDAQIPLDGSERMLESAQAAFVYERTTGTVIYAYNPGAQFATLAPCGTGRHGILFLGTRRS